MSSGDGGHGGGHGAGHHDPAMGVLHNIHAGHGTLEGLHGAAELLHLGGHAGHVPLGIGGLGLGMLGIPLGGISMAEGISNMTEGNYSQGVLDMASGGLGMTSGVASIVAGAGAVSGGSALTGGAATLAAAAPPLAIAAAIAGLGAYGNPYAEEHGWYGTDTEGHNNTFLGGIGNTASQGFDVGMGAGHGLFGDNVVGDVAGGVMGGVVGGLGGVGQTLLNSGAAVGAGAWRGLQALGGGISSLFSDERLKTNIETVSDPLAILDRL